MASREKYYVVWVSLCLALSGLVLGAVYQFKDFSQALETTQPLRFDNASSHWLRNSSSVGNSSAQGSITAVAPISEHTEFEVEGNESSTPKGMPVEVRPYRDPYVISDLTDDLQVNHIRHYQDPDDPSSWANPNKNGTVIEIRQYADPGVIPLDAEHSPAISVRIYSDPYARPNPSLSAPVAIRSYRDPNEFRD